MSKKLMSKELFNKITPNLTGNVPFAYSVRSNIKLLPRLAGILGLPLDVKRDVTAAATRFPGTGTVYVGYVIRNPKDQFDRYRSVVLALQKSKVLGDTPLNCFGDCPMSPSDPDTPLPTVLSWYFMHYIGTAESKEEKYARKVTADRLKMIKQGRALCHE